MIKFSLTILIVLSSLWLCDGSQSGRNRVIPSDTDTVSLNDQTYKIESSYDRFRDVTTIGTNSMQVAETSELQHAFNDIDSSIYFSASFSFPGTKPVGADKINMAFFSNKLIGQGTLNILIDDATRVTVNEITKPRKPNEIISIRGSIVLNLGSQLFKQIISAKKVEFRCGLLEWRFSTNNVEALRELSTRMKP